MKTDHFALQLAVNITKVLQIIPVEYLVPYLITKVGVVLIELRAVDLSIAKKCTAAAAHNLLLAHIVVIATVLIITAPSVSLSINNSLIIDEYMSTNLS
jgi:hypothetical protein